MKSISYYQGPTFLMIISASRRTDIPAFNSAWLFSRIEEGYVLIRNPMNKHPVQVE